ncbi:MAG: hypothetical protein O7D30_10800 [Rickettsia endosymbiont of Ixodes persulcatus]|nr:hypothetical protein [Rickettsia endosymbiont of Ixodes persulcatus]
MDLSSRHPGADSVILTLIIATLKVMDMVMAMVTDQDRDEVVVAIMDLEGIMVLRHHLDHHHHLLAHQVMLSRRLPLFQVFRAITTPRLRHHHHHMVLRGPLLLQATVTVKVLPLDTLHEDSHHLPRRQEDGVVCTSYPRHRLHHLADALLRRCPCLPERVWHRRLINIEVIMVMVIGITRILVVPLYQATSLPIKRLIRDTTISIPMTKATLTAKVTGGEARMVNTALRRLIMEDTTVSIPDVENTPMARIPRSIKTSPTGKLLSATITNRYVTTSCC